MDDLISYEKNDSDNLRYAIPPKGKHIFGMVKVGDEFQGIALIKETGLLGLINSAKESITD